MGRRHICSAALVPLGGGRIVRGPIDTRGETDFVGRTNRSTLLTEHHGSPGWLADYRRQFERTIQKNGEDPSIFDIALETLAIKAFGDMGPNARPVCHRT